MATTGHSTKQDILEHLLRGGKATANELAQALSVSPQGIRRHLKDLEADGLIEFESTHEGMGRPQHSPGQRAVESTRFGNSELQSIEVDARTGLGRGEEGLAQARGLDAKLAALHQATRSPAHDRDWLSKRTKSPSETTSVRRAGVS